MFAANSLISCALALHFLVLKSDGLRRVAKITFLVATAIVNILALGSWWTPDLTSFPNLCTPVHMQRTQCTTTLSTYMLGLASLFCTYSVTRSRAIAFVIFVIIPVGLVTLKALKAAFPANLENVLLNHPSLDHKQGPHWSVTGRVMLRSFWHLASHAAMSHATSKRHCKAILLPNLIAKSRSRGGFLAQASPWVWLSVLVAGAAVVNQPQMSQTISFTRVSNQHMRELLGTAGITPGQDVVGLTDSDRAGCLDARRSTCGGVVRHGEHTISWWCKLQSGVALSSCEAELNSTLKGAIEGLNVQRLANAFNDWPSLELRTDASASRGVIMRQGVGKVRHLHVKQMWIQEAVAAGELVVVRVPLAESCADSLTHAWAWPFGQKWGCDSAQAPGTRPSATALECGGGGYPGIDIMHINYY